MKDIINMGVEINEIENRKAIKKINETKCLLFEEIKKTENLYLESPKKGEDTQITRIRNDDRSITTDLTKIKKRLGRRIMNTCINKLNNSAEWTNAWKYTNYLPDSRRKRQYK